MGCVIDAWGVTIDACDVADWVFRKVEKGAEQLYNLFAEEPDKKAIEEGAKATFLAVGGATAPLDERERQAYVDDITSWLAMAQAAEADGEINAAGSFAAMVLALSEQVPLFWIDAAGNRVTWFEKAWVDEAGRIYNAANLPPASSTSTTVAPSPPAAKPAAFPWLPVVAVGGAVALGLALYAGRGR